MKLEFRNKKTTELKEGNLHFVNDGKPFEVDDVIGREFLQTRGEILKEVELEKIETEVEESEPTETVETLAKEKREVLEKRAKNLGLDGNSYTNRTELATAILAMESAEKENK